MELLTTKEAAQYLTIKAQTLEFWRCRGGGPQFIKIGRAVRYRKTDLDFFTEKNIRVNTSTEA